MTERNDGKTAERGSVADAKAEMSKETMRSARGIGASLSFKVLGFLAAFFFQIYYTRVLGPKTYGDFNLAISVLVLAAVWGRLGMDTGITRFVPQFRSGPFDEKMSAYTGFALRAGLLATGVVTALVIVFRRNISDFVSPAADITFYLLVFSPILLLDTLRLLYGAALRAAERFTEFSFTNDFLYLFSRGAFFTGSHQLGGGGVFSFLFGVIASTFLACTAVLAVCGRTMLIGSIRGVERLSRKEKSAFLAFGMKTLVYTFLLTGVTHTVRLMLGYFGDNSGVGIFAVAQALTVILLFLQNSFDTVFSPQAARLFGIGQTETLLGLYRRLSRWMLVAGLPYALVLLLNSEEILRLYGQAFASGADVLIVLIAAQLLAVLLGLNGPLLYMTGRENINLIGQLLYLAGSAVLSYLLIPKYGLLGAALAVAIGMAAMYVLFLVAVLVIYKKSQFTPAILKTYAAGAVLAAILHFGVLRVDFGFVMPNVLFKLSAAYLIFFPLIFLMDRREGDMDVLRAVWRKLGRGGKP